MWQFFILIALSFIKKSSENDISSYCITFITNIPWNGRNSERKILIHQVWKVTWRLYSWMKEFAKRKLWFIYILFETLCRIKKMKKKEKKDQIITSFIVVIIYYETLLLIKVNDEEFFFYSCFVRVFIFRFILFEFLQIYTLPVIEFYIILPNVNHKSSRAARMTSIFIPKFPINIRNNE